MKQIKTKSGFEVEIDERFLDDMEFVDVLAEAKDNDPLAISKVCKMMFGDANKKKLYDHVRKDGRVPIEAVSAEIIEIFQTLGDKGKNS